MEKIYLSIVIPQYNEIANLKKGVLQEMRDFLIKQDYSWEVIISDDGATDGSFDFTKETIKSWPNFKQLKNHHGGKASALNFGIKEAKGEIIVTTDMDQSTPLAEINKLLPYFKDYDIVIGSRGHERENFSFGRKLASTTFRVARKSLALWHINDTQCGFKAFKSNVLKKIFPKLDVVQPNFKASGWVVSAFDVELLFMAEKHGYKVKEVEVQWRDEDISTTKNRGQKFIKESLDMFKQLFEVRLNWIKGKYKKS